MTAGAGPDPTSWLIGKTERANPRTVLDAAYPGDQAWSCGNVVRPLVHGSAYFAHLAAHVEAARPGDLVLFTDWRGDGDERLLGDDDDDGDVLRLFGEADRRGVDVRGLIWRSHLDALSFSAHENRTLGVRLQEQGAEALLDMRVRTLGSHHQKLVVVRYRGRPEDDVAYVGGVDLSHGRRDDSRHDGDPQPQPMAPTYGPTPAWHDVQLVISGPAVRDVETVFRERWEDPTPLSRNPLFWLHDRLSRTDLSPDLLPVQASAPAPVEGGTHTVQLLRTYPNLRHGRDYPFARGGERSVARGYGKALRLARRLVSIEDQYLWSLDVARAFEEALGSSPELRVVAVLPAVPDQAAPLSRVPQEFARQETFELLQQAGGDRVAVYSLENHAGRPVYVHAKVCVMDDVWATVGSDNFNRRSWTHDSELSAVVVDEASPPGAPGISAYARRLRLVLAAEHLDREVGTARFPGDTGHLLAPDRSVDVDDAALHEVMADCVDEHGMFDAYAASAARLDDWYAGDQAGPRPAGRLRRLSPPHLGPLTKLWARPMARFVHDPDGRPAGLKRARRF